MALPPEDNLYVKDTGQPPNKGQNLHSQSVLYSEAPLYTETTILAGWYEARLNHFPTLRWIY